MFRVLCFLMRSLTFTFSAVSRETTGRSILSECLLELRSSTSDLHNVFWLLCFLIRGLTFTCCAVSRETTGRSILSECLLELRSSTSSLYNMFWILCFLMRGLTFTCCAVSRETGLALSCAAPRTKEASGATSEKMWQLVWRGLAWQVISHSSEAQCFHTFEDSPVEGCLIHRLGTKAVCVLFGWVAAAVL